MATTLPDPATFVAAADQAARNRSATVICLLAYLYLTVAVAMQRDQDASSDLDARLIPVTVPELLRLLRDIVIPPRRDRAGRCAPPGVSVPGGSLSLGMEEFADVAERLAERHAGMVFVADDLAAWLILSLRMRAARS